MGPVQHSLLILGALQALQSSRARAWTSPDSPSVITVPTHAHNCVYLLPEPAKNLTCHQKCA